MEGYWTPKQQWRAGHLSFYEYLGAEWGRINYSAALRRIFIRYLRAKKVLFPEDTRFFIDKMEATRNCGRFRDVTAGSMYVVVESTPHSLVSVRYLPEWEFKRKERKTEADMMLAVAMREIKNPRKEEHWWH